MGAAGAALICGALWLREPTVPYLIACAIATAATAVLTSRLHGARGWPTGAVAAAAAFCAVAGVSQRAAWQAEHEWPAAAASAAAGGERALQRALERSVRELRAAATRAVEAPSDPRRAFDALVPLTRPRRVAERAVVVYRGNAPTAWAGRVRALPDSLREPVGAAVTPFYLTLYAVARRGDAYAVATDVVHAEPPADRLARSLDRAVAARTAVNGFEVAAVDERDAGFRAFAPAGAPLFTFRAAPPVQAEVKLRTLERARVRGGVALFAVVVCFLVAAWQRRGSLGRRLAAVAVALVAVTVVPLNTFSNATSLFDPSYFYAPLGGPLSASVAALGLAGALLLLALLAVLRSPVHYPSRWLALATVLAIAGVGPFLLRKLAQGIAPPTWGVSVSLWMAWQVAIFLVAVSILLAGASAGRAALGARRGLPPAVAPAIAAGAALLGPILWEAPGRWPTWYPALWIAAIGALALTRRARGMVLTAATVAGFGAATLVWGATVRRRVELATADVEGLTKVDRGARSLLERFAAQLAADPPPSTRAELLRRYVASDLAAAEFPVALASWRADGTPQAVFDMPRVGGATLPVQVAALRAAGAPAPVLTEIPGDTGVQVLAAVPHADGQVTTVLVSPRTRLIPGDPFSALLGISPETAADPPYTLSLVEVGMSADRIGQGPHWVREGTELHGDWVVGTAERPARAHVEVELRSLDALVQRGVLVVLLDLGIVTALWTLAALADGGLARWLRVRGSAWLRSYRARLTVALFAFFVVPALVFAVWSYRRLQGDDRQSRELLVREALRAASPLSNGAELAQASDRLDTPLLLYVGGRLADASDPLYEAIAPVGRFLPPDVYRALVLGDELFASRLTRIGRTRPLFGYRVTAGPAGGRVVLAAPARTNEVQLDRRRRDLGILVLFSTVAGALAALWLSGIAARELARPIGALRRAALAVAAGEREPILAGEPPLEFQPVFAAYRRMATDLAASQRALEEARRRTEAVLRNVASGVIAVDDTCAVALTNPRADVILGRPLAPGTPLAALGAPEIERRIAAFVRAGAPDEEAFEAELGHRQLHGRLVRLGRPGGAVLTLDDVTELARAQRVLAWGEMARQVAHEIKNPLTPIRLGVQHLKRARADGREDFDSILDQNVARILAEIDRLDEIARAFSRYGTAPGERPAGVPVDVSAVARDVVELERMGADALTWELRGADRPAVARARDEELREVLLNLLENARLADARTVRVEVARANGRVEVTVADDGTGIAPEVLPRIFEPHFSTRTSGSGLGLAISRRLVEGWGGTMAVASQPGVGTRVSVFLVGEEQNAMR